MERAALAGSHTVCLFSSTSPGSKPPTPPQAPLEMRRWTAEKKSGISHAETAALPCTEAVVYRGRGVGTGKDIRIEGGCNRQDFLDLRLRGGQCLLPEVLGLKTQKITRLPGAHSSPGHTAYSPQRRKYCSHRDAVFREVRDGGRGKILREKRRRMRPPL